MEYEIDELKPVKMTRMFIGNEKGWIADIDLEKPCVGDNCINLKYTEDGKIILS